jgi:hypothetical protein
MPKFFPGDVVKLVSERASLAGGKTRRFSGGAVGRVCKVHAGGSYCVQFGGRCLRVTEPFLQAATGDAPACTASCRAGC